LTLSSLALGKGRRANTFTAPPAGVGGFTLVELVVVLLLLGIALAVAAPALPRPRTEEERAAAELRELLGRAREAAAARGGEVTLAVDLAAGTYRATLRRGREAADSLLREGALAGWDRAPLVRRGPDSLWVARFDPLGGAAAPPLRWRTEQGREAALVVDPWTGEVSLAAR
jgi:general secretion pathway protein H